VSIELVRIDERLIHGQIAYSWTIAYPVDHIMVIDDFVAKDPTQKMLLGLAVPRGKKYTVLTVEEATQYLKIERSERIFIVVKNPQTLLRLLENGIHFSDINVGGMYYKPGKVEISKTVYLNDEDKSIFRKIKDYGVRCEIRTSPNDKSINLFKYI